MGTFRDFRRTLSADPNTRGAEFERVCKMVLETAPPYRTRLRKVWLWNDWPQRWGPDLGIDLVAQETNGKYWAIQAKCYDEKYRVTKHDLDTFLSESF